MFRAHHISANSAVLFFYISNSYFHFIVFLRRKSKSLDNNQVANSHNTLHGGATASLVDIVGTLAILSKDHLRGGVSVDINTNYLLSVPVGDSVRCEGTVNLPPKIFFEIQIFSNGELKNFVIIDEELSRF